MKRYLNHIQRYWKRLKIQSKTDHDAERPESRKTRVLVPPTPRQVIYLNHQPLDLKSALTTTPPRPHNLSRSYEILDIKGHFLLKMVPLRVKSNRAASTEEFLSKVSKRHPFRLKTLLYLNCQKIYAPLFLTCSVVDVRTTKPEKQSDDLQTDLCTPYTPWSPATQY